MTVVAGGWVRLVRLGTGRRGRRPLQVRGFVSWHETCLTDGGRFAIIILHNFRVHSSFARERIRGGQLNEINWHHSQGG